MAVFGSGTDPHQNAPILFNMTFRKHESEQYLKELAPLKQGVRCLSQAAETTQLFSGSEDASIALWDLELCASTNR